MLNENGFYRPTYDEIVESKEQKAKDLFGEDIDTSELTPLGKFIRINAYDLAKAYEDLELTYYARFPNTATGTSLDRLCVFAGITRNPPTQAQQKIRVYGEQNYSFGMGELVVCGEDSDITFYNVNEYTIDQSTTKNGETVYYCDVIVECAEAGTVGNVTITNIVNPITQISEIEYISVEIAGEEAETDIELRKRFSSTISGAGSSNVNSIRAAILRVPTVTSVSIVVNESDTTDSSGRPPRSFESYVYGGSEHEEEIANAIFEKAPIGIKTCSTATTGTPVTSGNVTIDGNKVTVKVKDDGEYEHTIYFSKTAKVSIKLSIKYKKDVKFTQTGETDIKNALVEYINGLGVGENVILSKLYEYIYSVVGVTEVTELKVSTNGGTTWTTNNVTISNYQVAHISDDDITLTEVTS